MGLFGRKSNSKNRCPDCRYYVMIEGHGYCSKDVPEHVNVRLLSTAGARRQCVKCPPAMTCDAWTAK